MAYKEYFAQKAGSAKSEDYDKLEQVALRGLWHAARKFRPELGFQFSTYATRIIKDYYRSYYTLKKERAERRKEVPLEAIHTRSDDYAVPFTEFDRVDTADELGYYLSLLPAHYRQVVELRLQRYTFTEIGEQLNLSTKAVRYLHRNALRRLKKIVRERE